MSIIDKREVYKDRSIGSRQRFIERHKKYIIEGIEKRVKESKGISDVSSNTNVNISNSDTSEPRFLNEKNTGEFERILPGNKGYKKGDEIWKPTGSDGSCNEGSPDGEGEDSFEFILTKEEFRDLLFEGLELPNLIKKNTLKTEVKELVHAGLANEGNPCNLDIVRSFKNSIGRRISTHRKEYEQKLKELEWKIINEDYKNENELNFLVDEITKLKSKLKAIPYFDHLDLRYRYKDWQIHPTTQAVMFCLMDVSGSMSEQHKLFAKYFFILLYLFLQKNYPSVRVIFIKHHSSAYEVDEQNFFYSQETGGTVISTALDLCVKIIKERFSSSVYNIYVAQVSDGDNYGPDDLVCKEILINQLLPLVQYYFYIDVLINYNPDFPRMSGYMRMLEGIKADNLDFGNVTKKEDIYPLFRNFFKKRENGTK